MSNFLRVKIPLELRCHGRQKPGHFAYTLIPLEFPWRVLEAQVGSGKGLQTYLVMR